jgi:hypothetical protein
MRWRLILIMLRASKVVSKKEDTEIGAEDASVVVGNPCGESCLSDGVK